MPFNGKGQFTPKYTWVNEANAGTPILAAHFDDQDSDIAAALSNTITRDGQSTLLANLPMGGFKLTGLGQGTGPNDSVNYGQVFNSPAFNTPTATTSPNISDNPLRLATVGLVLKTAFNTALPLQSRGLLLSDGNTASFGQSIAGFALNAAKGADIPSAATIDLTAPTGEFMHVTGTTTITAITVPVGAMRVLIFDGVLTLKNGGTLALPGGADITTQAGDRVTVRGDTSGTIVVGYLRADGTALVVPVVNVLGTVLGNSYSVPAYTAGMRTLQADTIQASIGKLQSQADNAATLISNKPDAAALSANGGAALVGTSIANTVESELKTLRTTVRQNPRGASKEESRNLSTGVNWISNMRPTDPASVSGTAGFTVGSFNGNGSNNFAAWELPFVAQSYVCQGRLYWSGSNNNCFIGYNASGVAGAVDNSTFYSVGFASTGFVFNDKSTLSVLVPAANLTVGFYSAVMMYNNGYFLVSLLLDGSTKAQTFIVNETLSAPRNAQIGCYASGDTIRDFRFCATSVSNPFCPPFGGQRAMSTPISIPNTNTSGVQISMHLPAGYDPRITHRLAVYFHGSGGTDKDLWNYTNENTILTALLNAGYVVMSVGYGPTVWGNPTSVNQNVAAIQYIIDRYNVFSNPYIVGQSMGGMVSLNTVLVGGIKPAAFAGIYPASNLLYQYNNGFTSAIEGAYSFSGSANFAAATNGYDVVNNNPSLSFRGMNMKIWHSYGDTVVPRAPNSDALKTLAEKGGATVTIVTSSGDHGDPSSFDGAGIVSFFSAF